MKNINKKIYLYIGGIVLLIIVIVIILFLIPRNNDNTLALDKIYDVYPEEVRELYHNMVSIDCRGDISFNIEIDKEPTEISKLDKSILLDYLFSYMDKNELLNDNVEISDIKKIEEKLFYDNLNLTNYIKSYDYNGYSYDIKNNKLTKKKTACNSNIKNVLFLYGYFWNDNQLSIDINVAYLKDGILYDHKDEVLGEYDGSDLTKLSELTSETSYYRVNYVKDNKQFKLYSVEWKNRV